MPSVGMRRTTRVFGVVKGIDGARVLRSGRRIFTESDQSKLKNPLQNECNLLPNHENRRNSYTGPRSHRHSSNASIENKRSSYTSSRGHRHSSNDASVENRRSSYTGPRSHRHGSNAARVKCANGSIGSERKANVVEEGNCDQLEVRKKESLDDRRKNVYEKMYGLVYSRKRKRQHLDYDMSLLEGEVLQRRCKTRDESRSPVAVYGEPGFVRPDSQHVLTLSVDSYPSKSGSRWSISFADLLITVLRYLRMKRVSLQQLFRFLMSNPISGEYSSHGIQLLPEPPTNRSGICKIFGARELVPLFSVNFSALPCCFKFMYSTMLLRNRFTPAICVYSPVNGNVGGIDRDERDPTECKVLVRGADNLEKTSLLHPSVRSSKLASRTAAHKNGVYSRSIQKRRSSLRSRRGRNSPLVGIDRRNGSLVSDLISRRKSGIPFSSVAHSKLGRSEYLGSSIKEASSDLVGLKQNTDSSHCSVTILVTESDRCCREEGASVMLEMSDSGEWVLAVKKDGLTRYILKAQKFMRPSSSNRVTHGILWTTDSSWKLEFPRRQDWVTFKDLYRECFDRNVCLSPTVKAIPVPGVREVIGYSDQNICTFCRPGSYITMKIDEVSRTLANKFASYDMDDEDEEWLNKLNNEFVGADKLSEHLTPENFELMIDAYEKAYYCCPDSMSDQKAAAKFCSELGQMDVMEAVYSYWMKKRKKKRSALVRVFQVQQPRRASLVPIPALRKKRSFKRQGSNCGRGKQPPTHLRGMAAEQRSEEEQNAVRRVGELKASANKSSELATLKRKRAQFLIQNADLATYRAKVALKIAEAAQYAESLDCDVAHLL